ncbi:MAG: response regulator transcription factor [Reichenbachiella sp.]|uniref:response regulator transcription factor n=1 Tax=Reichenbachiella sp. TaxID=2184521 RepID=UPI0032667F87
MIKILIVDDHHLFAEGVKSMFKSEDNIEVTHYTANGNEVLHLLSEHEIDVILMDMSMPILDGIATMTLIKEKGYDVPVLMLTMHQSIKQVKGALGKGAQGYILKDASKAELKQAIELTSQRKNYFHPKISDQVFDYFRGKSSSKNEMNELSEREIEIIKYLADGRNSKAIAKSLFISEHTVKTHRRNIMHKLHVKTSAELIKLAMDKEII